ncbi:alpha/beta hydrolase [Cryptosporangium sp. NPDC051539]|uniref:alpha/beta hydrolase n=1 Tax=Cryptosporangium sp. NPDC051539 TaxID=3363962 RepID=UPI0037A3D29E
MNFTAETSSNGVLERDFLLHEIPGVHWSAPNQPATDQPAAIQPAAIQPATDRPAAERPLVLLAHGGGQHKRAPGVVARAQRLVASGFDAVSLDAPGHGGRPRTESDERDIALMRAAMQAGEPVGEIVSRFNGDIAERAVPEWRAVLDAIGPRHPVGFFGLALGTAIGVPLVAAEPRISAAVLGVFWGESLIGTAQKITVPIEFLHQWDDEHITRESGLSLFDAFASTEKTLHANSGAHLEVPRFEVDSTVAFFRRHLR